MQNRMLGAHSVTAGTSQTSAHVEKRTNRTTIEASVKRWPWTRSLGLLN